MAIVRVLTVVIVAASLGALSPTLTRAQVKRPMSILDVAELPRTSPHARLSPDGKSVAYFRTQADWKSGRLVAQLWRQDVGGGAPVQLTSTEAGVIPAGLRWSPDSQSLMFLRDGQVHLIPRDGGEPKPLTRHATAIAVGAAIGTVPAWSPDTSALYFLARDPVTNEEREQSRITGNMVAFEENVKPRRLWKLAIATGVETAITSGPSDIREFRLSADGRRIALQRSPTPVSGEAYRSETWVMDADGGNLLRLTTNEIEESYPEFSPDGSQLLFMGDMNARFDPHYMANLFVVPVAGGTPRPVWPDAPYAIDQATWAADGKSIYAVCNMGVHSEVFQIDVATGRPRQLTNGDHAIVPGFSLVPGAGRFAFQLDEPTRFGEVYTLPIAGGTPTRVTRVFDALERDFALPRQEKIEWKGRDGKTIEGILISPLDYRPGTRYPLVVQLHGGPMDSDKFGAGPDFIMRYYPVLAAKGYAILRPNYRGSTGYGNDVFRDVVGHYFNNMQHDVMAGVDHVIRIGLADPDRLALSGWSAGGHLVNKLITMTDRFKAASSGASLANWLAFYGQTDSRSFRITWFGGTPWQKDAPIAAFWDHSPIKDVANVKTPTVFFASRDDTRVPMMATVEMWRALKTNGVTTALYTVDGEEHQWGQLRHLVAKANRELEWFERHVMGRTYSPEKTP